MLDIRPVDCFSRAPLDVIPGYVSNMLYSVSPSSGGSERLRCNTPPPRTQCLSVSHHAWLGP